MTRGELEGQVERLAGRVEFWQLRALVAESRVRVLEDAVRGHRKSVRADVAERAALTVSDRELWGVL